MTELDQIKNEYEKLQGKIKIYEDALRHIDSLCISNRLGELKDSSASYLAITIMNNISNAWDEVERLTRNNPYYNKVVRIKKDIDYEELEALGYYNVIIEGGYVSKDHATIIISHRDGHRRKVEQYSKDTTDQHVKNVNELMQMGLIDCIDLDKLREFFPKK